MPHLNLKMLQNVKNDREITMSSANEPSNCENNIKIKILLNAFSLNHSPSL